MLGWKCFKYAKDANKPNKQYLEGGKSAKESLPPAHVSFSPGSAVLNNPHFLKRFIFEKKAECSRQYRTLDGVVCNHLMESHIKTHRQQSVASQSCLACRHFPIFLRMVDVKLSHLCVVLPTVKKVWEVNLGRSSSGACLDETRSSVDTN